MKILYIHGLGSTKNGNTVQNLKKSLPEHEIVAYDFPLDPTEGYNAVSEWSQDCDLVVGTSLGGFYAQFADCPKILVNPALQAARNLLDYEGKGTFEYYGPREDGVQEYTLDDDYYKKLTNVEHILYDEKLPASKAATADTTIIFGTDDEELGHDNWDFAKSLYGAQNITLFEGMGHRVNERYMPELMGIIRAKLTDI